MSYQKVQGLDDLALDFWSTHRGSRLSYQQKTWFRQVFLVLPEVGLRPPEPPASPFNMILCIALLACHGVCRPQGRHMRVGGTSPAHAPLGSLNGGAQAGRWEPG